MSVPSDLSPRRLKRLLKDYVRALKSDPGNLVLRLKVAFVFKELGRTEDSIEMYQDVARVFAQEGRLVQAIAVCKGILEIDPEHHATQEMLAELIERQQPARRQPALRMQQIDGRWIAIPVPVESGLVTATRSSSAALVLPDDAEDPATGSRGFGEPRSGAAADASGPSARDLDASVNVLATLDLPPLGALEDESLPPAREDELAQSDPYRAVTRVPGQNDGRADERDATGRGRRLRSMPVTGELGPLLGDSFAGLPELEPNVDDLPGPPGWEPSGLDFPPEAKSHARGAMLLDLPPSPGGRYEEPAGADGEATRAASPSTLRKQVLREASRLRMEAVTAESLLPADDGGVTVRARPPRASSQPVVQAVEGDREVTDRQPAPSAAEVPAYEEAGDGGDIFAAEEEAALRSLAELPRPTVRAGAHGEITIPLFSDLPRLAFVALLGKMVVRREEPGAVIVREGDPGDAFFVVVAGSVCVRKRRPDGQEIEVARLGPGAFFGEMALLAGQRRYATVVAAEDTELFEISRQVMAELSAVYPGVLDTLRRFHRERLLATLLQTTPLFQPLDQSERAQLATHMCIRKVPQGNIIVEQGKPTDGLYLILTGGVVVTMHAPDGAVEIELGQLGEGNYFGEMSLLRGGVASATVRARVATEVVQLPAREFYHVMAAHPVVWQEIRREAARREAANAALLTGRAGLL